MQQFLLFAVIGLGFGAVYAALAISVIVTHRGTGIINFAAGALGTWAAYVADELVRHGDLVMPVAVVPNRINLGGTVPWGLALPLGVVSTTVLGVLIYLLVFRPLRTAPILGKVIASIGVMLAIQGLVVLRFGPSPRAVAPILPAETFSWNDVAVPQDRLWLTATVILLAAAIWAWFRFARLGLALRAASENEAAIASAHFSPQRLAGLAWALASATIGVVAVLASPLTIMNPTVYTLAIVPALAAALVARFSSIPIATAVGLGLGSAQSLVVFTSTKTWWPDWARAGLADAVPFVILVVALACTSGNLPERGSLAVEPLPRVRRPQLKPVVVLTSVLAGTAAVTLTTGSYRFGVITSMIFVLLTLSIVVLTGWVGQISLAQAAFAGTAGFVLSAMTTRWSIPFPLAPLLAATCAAGLGLIVAVPAVRIRGSQLAVVTLGLAVAAERFVFRNNSLTDIGGNPIANPTLFGIDLRMREGRTIARLEFGLTVLVIVTVTTLAVANLMRGRTGLRFLSIRSNERAAAGLGINVAATKLMGFAVSSFLAGLAGTLIGYSRGQLSADSFTAFVGLSFLAFAYLGGISSLSGAILGATFVPLGIGAVIVDRAFPSIAERYLLLSGIGLVLTALFNPTGIAGANRANMDRAAEWLRTRRGLDPSRALTGQANIAALPHRSASVGQREIGSTVLDVHDVEVRYGGLRAVDRVSLQVRSGEVVGLIGPNGAGKTTLLDAISGYVPYTGSIRLRDGAIDTAKPHERTRRGIGRSWQSSDLFADLTIRENLQVAAEPAAGMTTLRDVVRPERIEASDERVEHIMRSFALENTADRLPSELSLGRQKLVSVARSVVASPAVVLLDEPAAGLDDRISRRLLDDVQAIARSGVGVLVIDHDTDFMFDVCDRILVLDFGRVIAEGPGPQVRNNPAVIAAYLGDAVLPPRWEQTHDG